MQLAHRPREILHLRQDEVFELGRVADERVGRSHAPHRPVEPGEALVGDLRRDLGAVAPRERVLVRDEHLVRLANRRGDRRPIHGREAAQIDHLDAHALLFLEGVSVEVIDLRCLSPVDWTAIAASVRKTNKVLVAYEDALSWGYGAEIAAKIADECFPWLDGPVRRVASTDTFVGYAPELEDFILPQVEDLTRAMRELHAF